MNAQNLVKTGNAISLRPEPGMVRQVLAHNDQMMIVRHFFEADWVGARHSHPHGQTVYVVAGALRVEVGTSLFEVHAGDSFVVEGGIEHQAAALEPSEVLDFFTPARKDYQPAEI